MNPRRLPVWIWQRALDVSAGLRRLCGQQKWRDGRWHVCPQCDRAGNSPMPPNYR